MSWSTSTQTCRICKKPVTILGISERHGIPRYSGRCTGCGTIYRTNTARHTKKVPRKR